MVSARKEGNGKEKFGDKTRGEKGRIENKKETREGTTVKIEIGKTSEAKSIEKITFFV